MKFDTKSIEGFESMSAEDKVAALLAADLPDADYSGYVKKDVFDAKASETARLERQVRELQSGGSDSEKAMKELQEKVASLEREKSINAHKASLLALGGYDDKTAGDAATALVDGEMDKFFTLQKTANEKAAQAIRAAHVKSDPKPDGAGGVDDGAGKISDAERLAVNISKARTAASKNAASVINKYTGGK